jgi:hypothetical protein
MRFERARTVTTEESMLRGIVIAQMRERRYAWRKETAAMEILDCIREQIAGNRLPLVGVTLAAVPCPDTPVILTLHWHGFRKGAGMDDEPSESAPLAPVPSSSLQLNERWSDVLDLDCAAMEAGWELGAWDVVRAERPACMRSGAGAAEAVACLQAFGSSAIAYRGAGLIVSEAPDQDELVSLAAQRGYLHWQFHPVHGGIWGEWRDDVTLNDDGTRAPRCPLAPLPPRQEGKRCTVYRFGEPSESARDGAC